jgi:N-acetyl-anhydromuramoyl-L-alanine amidase
MSWAEGWWSGAQIVASPNFGRRPTTAEVSLVVLHSISLPPGRYGGDEIERLFTNRLDPDADPAFAELRGLQVSAHFVVRRDGQVLQFVSCDARAWHAGVSHWRGRDNCNDFSVGIELEGLEGEHFEPAQYERLATLLRVLQKRYGRFDVAGHEHVAPGRKRDPGSGFDWAGLKARLHWRHARFPASLG